MLEITATELKVNLGHYLKIVENEDIWIKRNGKIVAKLSNPNISSVDSIAGILKGKVSEGIDRHSLVAERTAEYAENDD